MSNLKEALYVVKGGKYVESHRSDTDLMAKFVDAEKFKEKLGFLYENPDWMRFRKHLRCLRCLQLLVGSLMLVYIIFFAVALLTTLTPGKVSSYEYLYLGFCTILVLFFLMILYMAWTEAKVYQQCRKPILKKVTEMVAEEFVQCSFLINMDRCQTIRVRPLMMGEGEGGGGDLESMDYYDYINYNNPEDDDYYNKQNPYQLDPHEKDILSEAVKSREKELEISNKKSKKLKFLGGPKQPE
jgi:hypothetical protein